MVQLVWAGSVVSLLEQVLFVFLIFSSLLLQLNLQCLHIHNKLLCAFARSIIFLQTEYQQLELSPKSWGDEWKLEEMEYLIHCRCQCGLGRERSVKMSFTGRQTCELMYAVLKIFCREDLHRNCNGIRLLHLVFKSLDCFKLPCFSFD